MELEPEIIGVNNRNLADFSVSLNTTVELCPMIGANTVVVSESGIHTGEDVIMLEGLGINAVLVGEELVTSPDPAARIKKLMSW